jgi:large subunit ribosomal protein L15
MAKNLSNLSPAKGSVKTKRRRGRGVGSGLGNTAGRGHKGDASRSGAKWKIGFEGGQMPIHRRLPKRGFHNIFREEFQIVNLAQLEKKVLDTTEVTPELLVTLGLIKHVRKPVKILGFGEVTRAFSVDVAAVSATAKEKIEAAGGSVTVPPIAAPRTKYKKKSERIPE